MSAETVERLPGGAETERLEALRAKPRWRPHIGARLLIVATFLAALALLQTPGALLAVTLALLALSLPRRIRPSLIVLALLSCLALEALALLTPGEAPGVSDLARGLALPAGWAAAIIQALAQTPAYAPPPLVDSALLGGAKLVAIALAIAWFGSLTDTPELLDFFSLLSAGLPGLRSPLYILSTLLAVLPSIQTDVRKSLDAAMIRGGGRAALLAPGAWAGALTDTIVRVALRGERLAAAASARGFRLRDGLTPLTRRPFTLADGLLVGAALGACALLVLRFWR